MGATCPGGVCACNGDQWTYCRRDGGISARAVFEPGCPGVGELSTPYTCCRVNNATFVCPDNMDCKLEGCCERVESMGNFCYAPIPLESALDGIIETRALSEKTKAERGITEVKLVDA